MSTDLTSIYQLQEPSRRLVAFVGAGLSVSPPTGLPTGSEMLVSLLGLDWVDGDEKFSLSEPEIRENLRHIRFEHLLSLFAEWGKHDLAELLGQFADAEPNGYHKRIAELCREGVIDDLITTNFDSCLEKALGQQGVRYNVIVSARDSCLRQPGVVNVLKIHGSIEKRATGYRAIALGATLDSVFKGLPAWRCEKLLELMHDAVCVFLGYGGLDSYDINPFLFNLHSERLCWVAHTKDASPWIAPEVSRILVCSRYERPVAMNTATFLDAGPVPDSGGPFHFRQTYLLEKHFHPSVFVGRVLEAVGDYHAALTYYKRVKQESTLSLYWMVEILNIIRSIAVCHYELGDFESAHFNLLELNANLIVYVERMRRDAQTPRDLADEIFLDQAILLAEERALVESRRGKGKAAFESIQVAFECLARRKVDPAVREAVASRLYLNQANIMLRAVQKNPQPTIEHDLRMILGHLEKAAELKQKAADVAGLIQVHAVCGICLFLLGKQDEAEEKLFQLFFQLQKLRTPPRHDFLATPAEVIGYLIYGRQARGGRKSYALYAQTESPAKDELKRWVAENLLREPFRDLSDALEAFSKKPDLIAAVESLQRDLGAVAAGPPLATHQVSSPEDTGELMKRAEAEFQAGQYDRAIETYGEALAQHPGHLMACMNLSNVKRLQGRLQEALEELDAALTIHPEDPRLLTNKGNLLYELKRPYEALEALDDALLRDPNDALAWNNRGNCLDYLERYNEALAAYDEALRLNPIFREAFNNRETTRMKLLARGY